RSMAFSSSAAARPAAGGTTAGAGARPATIPNAAAMRTVVAIASRRRIIGPPAGQGGSKGIARLVAGAPLDVAAQARALVLGRGLGQPVADVLDVGTVVAEEDHQQGRGAREIGERDGPALGVRQAEVGGLRPEG